MNYTVKYLSPCALYSDKTFEEYCAQIPQYFFRKEVPEDVLKSFEVVTSLLAHSYYNYLYIDEAYSKALRVFEMAMKLRLIELDVNASKWTFAPLAKKLLDLKMFDSNERVLDYVKDARNHFSHPKHHSFAGIVYWNRIAIVPTLINELYEDLSLRTERQALKQKFTELINDSGLENDIVLEYGDEIHLLHSMQLLLVNNKVVPHTYQLFVIPLFDLTQINTEIIVPKAFELVIHSPNFSNGYLEAKEFGSNLKIVISPIISKAQYMPRHTEWKDKYDAKLDIVKFMYHQGIKNSIGEFYYPAIEAFQKL